MPLKRGSRTVSCLMIMGIAVVFLGLVFFTSTAFADQAVHLLFDRYLQSAPTHKGAEVPPIKVSQPWGWVDGVADPGSEVAGTLNRAGTVISTSSTTTDQDGNFTFDFRDAAGHLDLQPGDVVAVTAGSLQASITVVSINGAIDLQNSQVVGQVAGGTYPTDGLVKVGRPSSTDFYSQEILIGSEGQFTADFSSLTTLTADDVALVVYKDPNGNAVQQTFFPEGLDVRILTIEGRVEGVTLPGTEVGVLVTGGGRDKASARVTANSVGFFSAELYVDNRRAALALGDHVTVMKLGQVRETDVTLHHSSYILPWSDRVVGTVYGVPLPSTGIQGRLELWSAEQGKWYSQFIGIGPDGSYGADFTQIAELSSADIIRITAEDGHGVQQSVLSWALSLGTSTSSSMIWGYTTAGDTAQISLYRGLENNQPTGLMASDTVVADNLGYFETVLQDGGQPVQVSPSNVLVVVAGEHQKTLFVGNIEIAIDTRSNAVKLFGPPNARVHLEGRRPGVLREDAPFQNEYIWTEVTLGPNGEALVFLSDYDLQEGDWFDMTFYGVEDGVAFHSLVNMPASTGLAQIRFLPIVVRRNITP
jgi:hypothetical protein